MYQNVYHSNILNSGHTGHSCVLRGSQNKQLLPRCTAVPDWFLSLRRSVFTARYELILNFRLVFVL